MPGGQPDLIFPSAPSISQAPLHFPKRFFIFNGTGE
jgi:hypothetical protein